MHLLGHVQVRGLEDAVGNPERDPVDEKALPQLERGGRREIQPRKVSEVAPERLPALGFLLCLRPPSSPDPHVAASDQQDRGVHDQANPERDQEDVVPTGGDRVEALNSDPEHQRPRGRKRDPGTEQRLEPIPREPPPLANRARDGVLERLEALAVFGPVLRDAVAEPGEALGPAREDCVHYLRHRNLDRRSHGLVALR